ncbi:hypothetical protein [Haloarcula marismortui]|uniref:Uncharacterized protein n=1 Tax=Haloarcula marismortui ATCC 33800 TaxID=662476 RepID=M0JII3_9EURY|nr:hypothetical protein [Haloarcula sinaiiensis]EMA08168.1 hypothetical protein C436_20583 [Haloarcula sinaiiensis ATCC 33800]QUJ74002.1 hypothetical protein KDQ40_18710 [Haloarcula sinaiiensis ATCC 33800]
MNSRRRFLSIIGVAAFTGCQGITGETADSTPTDTPTPTPTPSPTPTPTDEATEEVTETEEPTPTETPEPNLSGREHYFNWIHGEDDQILEENKGQNGEISFQAIDNALEEGFENGGRNQAIAQALETASQEYTENSSYEDRHRHILSALHTTLEQKEGDQWDFEIFGMKDWGLSPAFNNGIDYSKIWVENQDGEYTDINAGLSERYRHTTHIQGEDIGNTAKNISNRIQEQLQFMRNPEKAGTHPGQDYEALQKAVEVYRNAGREYSDEDIEEANGFWIEKLSNHITGDGIPVPSSIEDWKEYDEGLEAGPEVFLGLNEAYHNAGYDGEPAQFTVKDAEDGSVSMEDLPDNYTVAEDGVPGNPAA